MENNELQNIGKNVEVTTEFMNVEGKGRRNNWILCLSRKPAEIFSISWFSPQNVKQKTRIRGTTQN